MKIKYSKKFELNHRRDEDVIGIWYSLPIVFKVRNNFGGEKFLLLKSYSKKNTHSFELSPKKNLNFKNTFIIFSVH